MSLHLTSPLILTYEVRLSLFPYLTFEESRV
nr:MAG TPA: hypothetical protein [Caudoviricetes sp.]